MRASYVLRCRVRAGVWFRFVLGWHWFLVPILNPPTARKPIASADTKVHEGIPGEEPSSFNLGGSTKGRRLVAASILIYSFASRISPFGK